MADRQVFILRQFNRIAIEPSTREIRRILLPHIQYTTQAYRQTYPDIIELYKLDALDRIVTFYGLTTRIMKALIKAGYAVTLLDLEPHPHPEVFIPDWSRLKDFGQLRPLQEKALAALVSYDHGRIDCPTGFGKSALLRFLAGVCPRLKVDFICKSASVIRERVLPELRSWLPGVGIIDGQEKIKDRRITLISADSLHHGRFDADMVIVDECQQAGADQFSTMLLLYKHARLWGLSATHDMRPDRKDRTVEALLGPIRLKVSYQQAVDRGLIVPIEVRWSRVSMDYNPVEGESDPVERLRFGIWTNDYRNEVIADVARQYDDDTQVLIVCGVIEHAVNLKALLPEFELVYAVNGLDERDRWRYIRRGLLSEHEPRMTLNRKRRLTKWFEQGRLKKVIVTTVWNVGVSMNQLQVLIRAEAGGSPINDVQIPGRVSRINDVGKQIGIVHDFIDAWDTGFLGRSSRRFKSYQSQQWNQIVPKGSRFELDLRYQRRHA